MNNFAFLSDDIVFDVLEFAHFERLRTNSPSMKLLGGRWGEIAEKFCYFKLVDNAIVEYRLNGDSESFTAAANNRKDVAVNRIRLSEKSKFNETDHLIADAYESLQLSCEVIPNEFLEKLGNRFTKIVWFTGNEDQTKGEIAFLKRQLKSPHLRILKCVCHVLTRPELTDLLVDFVRKKNFQTLKVIYFATECISERIFLAAYDAWLQRGEREHLPSSVSGWISTEDLHEFTARIPNFRWKQRINGSRTEWSYSEKHPTADHYEMRIFYNDYKFDVKELKMSLSERDT